MCDMVAYIFSYQNSLILSLRMEKIKSQTRNEGQDLRTKTTSYAPGGVKKRDEKARTVSNTDYKSGTFNKEKEEHLLLNKCVLKNGFILTHDQIK